MAGTPLPRNDAAQMDAALVSLSRTVLYRVLLVLVPVPVLVLGSYAQHVLCRW